MKFEKNFNIKEAFLEIYPSHDYDKCCIFDRKNKLTIEYSICIWLNVGFDMRIIKNDGLGDFIIYEGMQPFSQEDFDTIIVPLLAHDHRYEANTMIIEREGRVVYKGPKNSKVDAMVNPSKETLDRVNNFLTNQEIRYHKNQEK